MSIQNPFNRRTSMKVAMWKTELFLRRQHRLVWYVLGLFLGWMICSEYNLYLDTGYWRMWPWE